MAIGVFISYSHDSEDHKSCVLELSNRLRVEGIDCTIDQYVDAPEFGWPKWMADQIENADYVLIVASQGYAERIKKISDLGRGEGVTWEAQLITQSIYEAKGRNDKFIPIAFTEPDVAHRPAFLKPTTYYILTEENNYELLYRRLTKQPRILKPSLGKTLQLPSSVGVQEPVRGSEAKFYANIVLSEPSIICLLPRGFILLDQAVSRDESHDSWSVIATHYGYDGTEYHGTHYHDSYRWFDKPERVIAQCRKLLIPKADYQYATEALGIMCDIRNRDVVLHSNGSLEGAYIARAFETGLAKVHFPGELPVQTVPANMNQLGYFGDVRDIAVEAWELSRGEGAYGSSPREFASCCQKLKRRTRLAVVKCFSDHHPLRENLEELYPKLADCLEPEACQKWAAELAEVLLEGVHSGMEANRD